MRHDCHQLVDAAMRLMAGVPARPLVEVASLCGVSRHTLMRAFSCSVALPCGEVRRRCIGRKMQALMRATPPKSIKEISAELGFATPRSLARWVKHENGLVPRALREQLCRVEEGKGAGASDRTRGEADYVSSAERSSGPRRQHMIRAT